VSPTVHATVGARARRLRTTMFILALLPCACAPARSSERTVVSPDGAATLAPYSPGIVAHGMLCLSGPVGLRPGSRELVSGGITPETRQALANVRAILDAAGLHEGDVLKCTVFLVDMADYAAMNAEYGAFFRTAPPARTAVAVAALPLGARVEIDCIARTR